MPFLFFLDHYFLSLPRFPEYQRRSILLVRKSPVRRTKKTTKRTLNGINPFFHRIPSVAYQILALDSTQASNDLELHRLVHTRLLSGSLNPELNLTPAQRRKALEGRVLELADRAKLGQGEKDVRDAEKKRAALRIREGMKAKQKERDSKKLEEVREYDMSSLGVALRVLLFR